MGSGGGEKRKKISSCSKGMKEKLPSRPSFPPSPSGLYVPWRKCLHELREAAWENSTLHVRLLSVYSIKSILSAYRECLVDGARLRMSPKIGSTDPGPRVSLLLHAQ